MERAGAAVAALAASVANESGSPVLILAGPGNNGGDALVAARILAAQGHRVQVVSRADPARLPPDAARAWAAWGESGGSILPDLPAGHACSLVVDGLFGLGLQRDIAGQDARWIARANALDCPRLAIDLPSGIDGDSGRMWGCAFRADHTLTFVGLKPGLLTADGPDHAGTLHLDPLGIPAASMPATPGVALTRLDRRHQLARRPLNSHKGMYGRLAIIGGDRGMVGACLLAGRAALRYGAGTVTLGLLDERVVADFVEPRLMFAPPAQLLDARAEVLAIGPGLGQDTRAQDLLETALATACPLILDADALNLLAGDTRLAGQAARRHAPTLLTPHPGEAARLLKVTASEVQADRIHVARKLSAAYRAHVALKGAGTVIAHPDGRFAINTSGGPWLAQAGAGDRLTGMIAALIGQGMNAGDAIEAAVWLHGQAADAPGA